MRPRRTPAELRIVDRDRSLFRLWEPPDVTDEEIAAVDEAMADVRPVVVRRTQDELRLTDEQKETADLAIHANKGLIFATLKRVFPWTFSVARDVFDSLVSVSQTAVAKASRDYDVERGCEFSTLAVKYIVNDVKKHEKRRRRHLGRCVAGDLDRAVQSREMRPDKAAETWEAVRRNSTGDLFTGDEA